MTAVEQMSVVSFEIEGFVSCFMVSRLALSREIQRTFLVNNE